MIAALVHLLFAHALLLRVSFFAFGFALATLLRSRATSSPIRYALGPTTILFMITTIALLPGTAVQYFSSQLLTGGASFAWSQVLLLIAADRASLISSSIYLCLLVTPFIAVPIAASSDGTIALRRSVVFGTAGACIIDALTSYSHRDFEGLLASICANALGLPLVAYATVTALVVTGTIPSSDRRHVGLLLYAKRFWVITLGVVAYMALFIPTSIYCHLHLRSFGALGFNFDERPVSTSVPLLPFAFRSSELRFRPVTGLAVFRISDGDSNSQSVRPNPPSVSFLLLRPHASDHPEWPANVSTLCDASVLAPYAPDRWITLNASRLDRRFLWASIESASREKEIRFEADVPPQRTVTVTQGTECPGQPLGCAEKTVIGGISTTPPLSNSKADLHACGLLHLTGAAADASAFHQISIDSASDPELTVIATSSDNGPSSSEMVILVTTATKQLHLVFTGDVDEVALRDSQFLPAELVGVVLKVPYFIVQDAGGILKYGTQEKAVTTGDHIELSGRDILLSFDSQGAILAYGNTRNAKMNNVLLPPSVWETIPGGLHQAVLLIFIGAIAASLRNLLSDTRESKQGPQD